MICCSRRFHHLIWTILVAALLVLPLTTTDAQEVLQPCGDEIRCEIALGGYYLVLPEGWDGITALPIALYFHGWNATGLASLSNEALVSGFVDRGWAFVAADGQNRTWAHQGSPAHRHPDTRDEISYVRQIVEDLDQRLPIELRLATGFSQGGSMVWDVACQRPDLFDGFAPVAGAFWEPLPEHCTPGPRLLRHIHGTSDSVVPMEGRSIGDRWRQGDVGASWDLLQDAAGCENDAEFVRSRQDGLVCQRWGSCSSASSLDLCLHEGGHVRPAGWIEATLDWFNTVSQ